MRRSAPRTSSGTAPCSRSVSATAINPFGIIHMRITSTPRRGIALVTAILGILVIGALVSGIFFASNQNYRAGRNALYQERALTAAEFGQNAVLRDWNVDTAFLM